MSAVSTGPAAGMAAGCMSPNVRGMLGVRGKSGGFKKMWTGFPSLFEKFFLKFFLKRHL
jgi:hypothetical protein